MRKIHVIALSLSALSLIGGFQNCSGKADIGQQDSQSVTSPFPMALPSVTCTVFLTSGNSWRVPGDWNSGANTIEAVGNGANAGGNVRGGGGGGAYSKSVNVILTPGDLVAYSMARAPWVSGSGGSAGDTYFCNSPSNCTARTDTAVVVAAHGGHASTNGGNLDSIGGAGGEASAGIATGPGAVKYSGGAAGNCSDGRCAFGAGPGSGGGAAGPNGNGANGGNGAGGTADGGLGGIAGTAGGGAGGPGTEWDSTHGAGAGGGSGATGVNSGVGGAGGNYGGGAGGGADSVNGGTGGGGLIVIKYTGTACK